jgi:hypothetical protein
MTETRRWFDTIQEEIKADYADAQATHKEDIQRSGHEGESTWADLLSKWLPASYGIGLRKYIIGGDEGTKPFETDIVIFEPSYPQHLRYRTKIHAGGVAAAFSVKLTARKSHVKETAKWSADLASLSHVQQTTVEGQLLSGFPVGFLAHSHDMGGEPIDALTQAFDAESASASHPRDLVDIVCIADAGTLRCSRASYIDASTVIPTETPYTMTTYMTVNEDNQFGAVAHFIVSLYSLLGRNDKSLRKLGDELAQVTGTNSGQGNITRWDPKLVYADHFLERRSDMLFDHGSPRVF